MINLEKILHTDARIIETFSYGGMNIKHKYMSIAIDKHNYTDSLELIPWNEEQLPRPQTKLSKYEVETLVKLVGKYCNTGNKLRSQQSKTKKRKKGGRIWNMSEGIKSIKSILTSQLNSIPGEIIGKR